MFVEHPTPSFETVVIGSQAEPLFLFPVAFPPRPLCQRRSEPPSRCLSRTFARMPRPRIHCLQTGHRLRIQLFDQYNLHGHFSNGLAYGLFEPRLLGAIAVSSVQVQIHLWVAFDAAIDDVCHSRTVHCLALLWGDALLVHCHDVDFAFDSSPTVQKAVDDFRVRAGSLQFTDCSASMQRPAYAAHERLDLAWCLYQQERHSEGLPAAGR